MVNSETINEVDFCSKMASAANAVFGRSGPGFPFVDARVEGMGSIRSSKARKDLRFYGPNQRLVLTGEVKLPGSKLSAFNADVVKDAGEKAEHAGVQFFFTWDVNSFVLWDRSKWQLPLLERRVNVWPLRLNLANAKDLARPEILESIERKFLPSLIADLADIISGKRRDWSLPPDEIFLRSLESHLDWPVSLLLEFLYNQSEADRAFDARLQEWLVSQDREFVRKQPEDWRATLDNAARTIAYIWTNRFIFYKALQARFTELPRLDLPKKISTAEKAVERINVYFSQAAERSGDYETLLFPHVSDPITSIVFAPTGAIDAWRAFLRAIDRIDFRDVPTDVVGLIFQKLISPEERHRFGQHFTGPDPVDLINSFCIRSNSATILDPACGSGSFLVRAYYRKKTMNTKPSHLSIISDLFGCDIALYPAHLATLNLAAREINDEANYPRIGRKDFFDYLPGQAFCEIPEQYTNAKTPIKLPTLDAVVGNPPYVRQEKIEKDRKPQLAALMEAAFSGTKLSGRADLHCYFWPHSAQFLREGGYLGFLTSSQWLDVDYGFALQRWALRHFKIISIMESSTERWFPDARVKTCITILQRCSDEDERSKNRVRFLRFEKPLAEVIGVPATAGVGAEAEDAEQRRQKAVDKLRDAIEKTNKPVHNENWRILLRNQRDLWEEGVRAGAILKDTPRVGGEEEEQELDEAAQEVEALSEEFLIEGDYAAGKWGRYLRAPDFYFEIMEKYRDRFIPLGEIVTVRFGVKTGCDAFFMPHDVTESLIADYDSDREFRKLTGVTRKQLQESNLRIIKDGAGTYHPIESQYIAPEVHSLMKVNRPEVRAGDFDRVVLLVSGPLHKLKGTWVHRYLKYGEEATFASRKSKAVPVPQRSTCAARQPWYDLSSLVRPGFAFWPMAQQYRHIIPGNPDRLICNHNLFDLGTSELSQRQERALIAILNSTLLAL